MQTRKSQHKRYILQEIARYPAIKEYKRRQIVAHAFGDINLRKTGQLLTCTDKALLRLSYDKPVTTEMIALVEPALVPFFDIDEALSLIVSNANRKHELHQTWDELIKGGETQRLEYLTPIDGLTCKWCRNYCQRPLKRRFNLPKNIAYNCNCPWFRGSVLPLQS